MIRVTFAATCFPAWHDDRWNGHVCRAPSKNTFCINLDQIRLERDEAEEDAISGKNFADLKEGEFPPCQADSGAFMNEKTWWRIFNHPYQTIESTKATHGNLIRTPLKVPPYSTFAVPFRWMLRQYQEEIGGYRGGAALLAMPRSWSASSARASRA